MSHLLHDTPEKVPEYGQWVCSCENCRRMVVAAIPHGIRFVLKGERDRRLMTAAFLAEHMAAGDLDDVGCGYVREIFVADPRS